MSSPKDKQPDGSESTAAPDRSLLDEKTDPEGLDEKAVASAIRDLVQPVFLIPPTSSSEPVQPQPIRISSRLSWISGCGGPDYGSGEDDR